MYISFPREKILSHRKVYGMLLSPKEDWATFPSTAIAVPFSGTLLKRDNNKKYEMFSMYYTLDKTSINIENIEFINKSAVFNDGKYKELLYNHLFYEILNHKRVVGKNILTVSSKDPFAVNQMIEFNFRIKRQQLMGGSELYTGLLINGNNNN